MCSAIEPIKLALTRAFERWSILWVATGQHRVAALSFGLLHVFATCAGLIWIVTQSFCHYSIFLWPFRNFLYNSNFIFHLYTVIWPDSARKITSRDRREVANKKLSLSSELAAIKMKYINEVVKREALWLRNEVQLDIPCRKRANVANPIIVRLRKWVSKIEYLQVRAHKNWIFLKPKERILTNNFDLKSGYLSLFLLKNYQAIFDFLKQLVGILGHEHAFFCCSFSRLLNEIKTLVCLNFSQTVFIQLIFLTSK